MTNKIFVQMFSRRLKQKLFFISFFIILSISCKRIIPNEKIVKISCIGDSITFGLGIKNRKNNSYPAQLMKNFSGSAEVKNFSRSGATLLNSGDLPYRKTNAYSKALKYNADVIIILLGTNDSKANNWKFKKYFMNDYKILISKLRKNKHNTKFYLVLPPPIFTQRWGINMKTMLKEIVPKIKSLAKELGYPLINLYKPLQNKADLFFDGIHPNAKGAKKIAEIIFHNIKLNAK